MGDQDLNPVGEHWVTLENTSQVDPPEGQGSWASLSICSTKHFQPTGLLILTRAENSFRQSPGELVGESPCVPVHWESECPMGCGTVSTTVNKTCQTLLLWNLHGGWSNNTHNKKIIVCLKVTSVLELKGQLGKK